MRNHAPFMMRNVPDTLIELSAVSPISARNLLTPSVSLYSVMLMTQFLS